jgi:hypothetical protein
MHRKLKLSDIVLQNGAASAATVHPTAMPVMDPSVWTDPAKVMFHVSRALEFFVATVQQKHTLTRDGLLRHICLSTETMSGIALMYRRFLMEAPAEALSPTIRRFTSQTIPLSWAIPISMFLHGSLVRE